MLTSSRWLRARPGSRPLPGTDVAPDSSRLQGEQRRGGNAASRLPQVFRRARRSCPASPIFEGKLAFTLELMFREPPLANYAAGAAPARTAGAPLAPGDFAKVKRGKKPLLALTTRDLGQRLPTVLTFSARLLNPCGLPGAPLTSSPKTRCCAHGQRFPSRRFLIVGSSSTRLS